MKEGITLIKTGKKMGIFISRALNIVNSAAIYSILLNKDYWLNNVSNIL